MMRIGGHFHSDHPLEDAVACGARTAQFFLGDPQGWKGPVFPGGDPVALKDAYAAADVDIYIHAPYIINVASANNRIRIPSRKLLDQQLKAGRGHHLAEEADEQGPKADGGGRDRHCLAGARVVPQQHAEDEGDQAGDEDAEAGQVEQGMRSAVGKGQIWARGIWACCV